jgi:hypothetical protein
MSGRLALLLLLLASPAPAVEVETEASAASDFFYSRTHAAGELLDGHATLGGGLELVSDWRVARVGLEANADAVGEHFSAGLGAGWAPRQSGRGWIYIDPHGTARLERERWSLDGELGVKLRRADVAVGRTSPSVDQLQLRFEGHAILRAWQIGVRALYSFYDPDLARYGPSADAGILITVGGKPERWALAVEGSRKLPRSVTLELGLGAVGYAVDGAIAFVPRGGLRVGPFRGVTAGASVELVCLFHATPHPIGGLTLEYER